MNCPTCGTELNDGADFTVCSCGADLRKERRAFGDVPWVWAVDDSRAWFQKFNVIILRKGRVIDNTLEYARYEDGKVVQVLPEGKTVELNYESVTAILKAGWYPMNGRLK